MKVVKQYLLIRKEINGVSYLFWNRYYWLEIGKLQCRNCARIYTRYKKFFYRLGILKAMSRQYIGNCSDCKVELEEYNTEIENKTQIINESRAGLNDY